MAEKNKKAYWLRFDIPYQPEANLMRAVLGYRMGGEVEIQQLAKEGLNDIPQAIDVLTKKAMEQNIKLDDFFMLVFPLDERMTLAHIVLEESTKRNWQFDRHEPEGHEPFMEMDIPFAGEKTGSLEDDLSHDEAKLKIIDLNSDAGEDFRSQDLLAAINFLRYALHMVVKFFGWTDPLTTYTIRNLVMSYKGTGNYQNEKLALRIIRRLLYAFENEKVDNNLWDDETKAMIKDISDQSITLGDPEVVIKLLDTMVALG